MDIYQLMVETNYFMIKGGILTDGQKQAIGNRFLSAVSDKETVQRFYVSVKCRNNIDNEGHSMYPIFFIPLYNDGKKYKTLMTQTPKTHILSANLYELEILRLLYILTPNNETVIDMVLKTITRLKTTCFGNRDDGVGECYDTSLIVLRFLASVAKQDTIWIKNRIHNFYKYFNDKHRHWGAKWYYWLCLSELPLDIAESEILKYKQDMLKQMNRSYVMNSENDKLIHPVILCVVRNCLSRLPEYEYIKERLPYVNEKDGRLYFNMHRSLYD